MTMRSPHWRPDLPSIERRQTREEQPIDPELRVAFEGFREDERPRALFDFDNGPETRNSESAKAQLFKSIGHPERIRILEVLGGGEHPVSELLGLVGLAPSAMSRHLAILRGAGVVERRRHHHRVAYRLCHPKTSELLTIARTVLGDADRRSPRQPNT
jgi:DNA-binding transcriptional ArsR family regulator